MARSSAETLDLFVEGSLGSSEKRKTDTTTRFLDEQIAEYEKWKLAESEQRLC